MQIRPRLTPDEYLFLKKNYRAKKGNRVLAIGDLHYQIDIIMT